MTETEVAVPPEEKAEIVEFVPRVILGGRTLEAMRVRETMDEISIDLKNTYEHPSGFMIVVWDEEGYATSKLFRGDRFPLPPTEIVTCITELVKADLWKSSD